MITNLATILPCTFGTVQVKHVALVLEVLIIRTLTLFATDLFVLIK